MELLTQLLQALWAQDFETLANPSMIGMLYFVLFVILFLENGLLPAAFLPGDSLLVAWMPMLFADLGCILGGYLPPLFQRWFGVNLIVSRKMVVTLGAVLMIGPGMIGLFTNPYVAIMLLCIGGFAHQALSGALITLSSDVFGRNEVATANGLTGMSAWLASTLFALVVGALADTIGFSPLFAVLAVFDLLGALVIWTVLQNKPAIEVAQETHNDPAPQH